MEQWHWTYRWSNHTYIRGIAAQPHSSTSRFVLLLKLLYQLCLQFYKHKIASTSRLFLRPKFYSLLTLKWSLLPYSAIWFTLDWYLPYIWYIFMYKWIYKYVHMHICKSPHGYEAFTDIIKKWSNIQGNQCPPLILESHGSITCILQPVLI